MQQLELMATEPWLGTQVGGMFSRLDVSRMIMHDLTVCSRCSPFRQNPLGTTGIFSFQGETGRFGEGSIWPWFGPLMQL